jgi:hypothetical protein
MSHQSRIITHLPSIEVKIADGLTGRGVLGFLHGLFKFLGKDVFFVRFLEEGIRELVFTLPLLLLKDVRSLRQVYVRSRSYVRFVRKNCAKNRINHQFCLAAWASHLQVFAGTISHEIILHPFAPGA